MYAARAFLHLLGFYATIYRYYKNLRECFAVRRATQKCTEGYEVPEKIDILGVQVDPVTMDQAVKQVETYMDERSGIMVATANAEMIMRATHDEELMHILNDCASWCRTVPARSGPRITSAMRCRSA